jgi:hypothetical protein
MEASQMKNLRSFYYLIEQSQQIRNSIQKRILRSVQSSFARRYLMNAMLGEAWAVIV